MKPLATTLTLLFFISLSSSLSAQPFAGGSGTEADPWQIETAAQLDSVRHFLDGNFVLNNDIDLTTHNDGTWIPIGNNANQFTGSLYGQNYVISNINYQTNSDDASSGLFRYLNGTVKNIKIFDFFLRGDNAGALAGWAGGVIENVHAQGKIEARDYAGGIVGRATDSLLINMSSANIEFISVLGYFDNPNTSVIGGIVGSISDYDEILETPSNIVISDSYSTGSVSNRNDDETGGIVGYFLDGTIINSYSSLENLDSSNLQISLVGQEKSSSETFGQIENSYWNSESGADSAISSLGSPLTPEELREQSSFTSWDFDSIWAIGDPNGTSFPYLQSVIPDSLPGYQPNPDLSGPFAGGSGTEADPWQIETPAQLDSVRHYLEGHFVLNNDIDLDFYTNNSSGGAWNNGEGWRPISVFTGSFSGNYNSIDNLTINVSGNNIGLFGIIDNGFVTKLGLRNVDITGNINVGGLAGSIAFSSINKSYTTGTINSNGAFNLGGIAGSVTGSNSVISECYSKADLFFVLPTSEIGGGLVGYLNGEIKNSYALGNINGVSKLGRLVGEIAGNSIIQNSYSSGEIVGSTFNNFVGSDISNGLAEIINSYWIGSEIAFSNSGNEFSLSEMRNSISFSGWDFDSTWAIGDANSTSFPFLQSVIPDSLPGYEPIPDLSGPFAGGSGTLPDPWQIETPEQLDSVRHYLGGFFVLNNDIDLGVYTRGRNGGLNENIEGWKPIGSTATDSFFGTFDGNNNRIIDLYINRPDEDEIGLFGLVDDGIILNLHLDSVSIHGGSYVGAIAGTLDRSQIDNISVAGEINGSGDQVGGLFGSAINGNSINNASVSTSTISGVNYIGGLTGTSDREIINASVANSSVTGVDFVGGLSGQNFGKISGSNSIDSKITGNISVGGLVGDNGISSEIDSSYSQNYVVGIVNAGGLVGSNSELSSVIRHSYSANDTVKGNSNIGGFVGVNAGEIYTSYSKQLVIGTIVNAGGFVGSNLGYIQECSTPKTFYKGTLNGLDEEITDLNFTVFGTENVGGFVGNNSGQVIDSFNNIDVAGVTEASTAGFVGLNGEGGSILYSYTSSASYWWNKDVYTDSPLLSDSALIQVGPDNSFAFAAVNDATIWNSYWDDSFNEEGLAFNVDNGNGQKLTPIELRDSTSFTDWDFGAVWTAGDENGGSYPYLQAVVPDTLPGYLENEIIEPPFAGGSGTEADPWQIETPEQLDSVRHYLDGHFVLNNDIDLGPYTSDSTGGSWNEGHGWEPIASGGLSNSLFFNGNFNGNDYVIRNLKINRPDEDNIGFIGKAGNNAKINRIGFKDVQITGDDTVGVLIAYSSNLNEYERVKTSGIVNGSAIVGGILGKGGWLFESHSNVSISGSFAVGGLIGECGVIYDSYFSGIISGVGDFFGGLFGILCGGGSYNSYSTGQINVISYQVGGLAGVLYSGVIPAASSYWNSPLVPNAVTEYGTESNTSALKNETTFIGWDFENIWTINPDLNDGFPFITMNPPFTPSIDTSNSNEVGLPIFNGTTSYALLSDTSGIDLNDELTIELWVNFDDVYRDSTGAEFMTLFVKDVVPGSYGLILNTSVTEKTLTFYHQGLSESSTSFDWTDISANTWYHVAVTYNGTDAKIYIDGAERASQSVTGSIQTNDSDLLIGRYGGVNSYSLDGAIADFRIWNDARSQAEIQNNMNLLISGKEQNLVGNWIPRIAGYEGGLDFAENTIPITYSDVEIVDTTFPPLKMSFDGDEGWRFIGAPGDSTTYSELLEPIWTQGFTGADAAEGSSNVYFYDEENRSWNIPQNSTNLFGTNSNGDNTIGKGGLVYVYADDDFDGNDDPFPKTLSLDKELMILYDENIPVSYTETEIWGNDGWNLVSNPYPVSLYWLEIVADSANKNIEPFIYIWDHSMFGGFGGYAANYGSPSAPGLPGTANFDGRIAPFQSFWVKANAEGAELQLTKNHFITNTQAFKEQQSVDPFVLFRLEGETFQNESSVLFKRESETPGIPKLQSLSAQYADLYFGDTIGQRWLAKFEQLSEDSSYTIPLHIDISVEGEFKLYWDVSSIPEEWFLELEDPSTGNRINLREQQLISFSNTVSQKQSASTQLAPPPVPGNFGKQKRRSIPEYVLHISNTTLTDNEVTDNFPDSFELSQNYPNPFNPTTRIDFALPKATEVKLEVFDILGRKVATLIDKPMQPGFHNAVFNATRFASGVYLYRIQAGSFVRTRSFTLIK